MTNENPDSVPGYFANFLLEFGRFREENERQHGNLLKWMVVIAVAIVGALTGVIALAVA